MSLRVWQETLGRGFRLSPNAAPLLILLVLSAAVHLPGLSHPDSVVFDEVYFGRYSSAYCCSHEYIFDPHPPHAKLLIAAVAHALGYRGGPAFDHIGQSYGDVSPMPLRLVPALAGTFLPLVVFILLRQLSASPAAAFLGGLLLVFDNSLTAHTRLISLDGVLLLAIFGALGLYLAAERAQTPNGRAGLSFLSGCAAGLAVGSKFTGLVIVGLIGLCILQQLWPRDGRVRISQTLQNAAWLATGALLVYAIGWVLHFTLLSKPGPGEIWGVPTGNLVTDIVQIHGKMFSAHADLAEPHPYGSPWWSWPLMKRPVFFWNSSTSVAKMYSVGNPVVWWGGTLLFIVVLVNLVLIRITHMAVQPVPERERPRFWLPMVGYAASYIPLTDVSRVMFMYHYFTPLIFSLILVVLWLDYVGWTKADGLRHQRRSYYAIIVILLLSFVLIAPLTYGLEAGTGIADTIFSIFPGWR